MAEHHVPGAAGVSPLATLMLGVPPVGVVLGLALHFIAVQAWRNADWSIRGRIHYAILALSTLAFVWRLNYWTLLGLRF
jgi:hypothetical protein